MTKRFAVVHEAEIDFLTATELADRELIEAIDDWLDEDQLPYQRSWQKVNTQGQPLTWKGLKRLAREAKIRSHGHFEGEPGFPDAAAARRAIDYLRAEFPQLDAVLLIRDQDDQPARRAGLEQARSQHHEPPVIVIGLAIVERDSWVLSGFDPANEAESSRLDAERSTLGCDPRLRSHELTACKDDNAVRSPKRVLRSLSGDDHDRQRRCWTGCPLEVLRQRGGDNGLAAFLREVRERLAPLIGHVRTKDPA